jgi:nucleoside-diphosphate-sugar epimerase
MNWNGIKVVVTGGASFIGSHLVDLLVAKGARVRVADNLSTGKVENIAGHLKKKKVELLKGDLKDSAFAAKAVKGQEYVFHLAADHGGRGYVDLHQAGPATNLMLDGNVFWQAYNAGVKKIVFASSGCVYPNFAQQDPRKKIFLTEDMVKPPYDSDNMYGWAKLMGELSLKAYYKEFGIKTCSLRYFTVYGPRGVENHAVIAMIARAFVGENPFQVWGTGEQVRNWTFVEDIVAGTVLAAEKVHDGTAINLGTMERIRVIDAAKEVLAYTGVKARLVCRPQMPTGPYNRVADNFRAKKLLGWEPKVKFYDGLHRTIDWYFSTRDRAQVKKEFYRKLTEK